MALVRVRTPPLNVHEILCLGLLICEMGGRTVPYLQGCCLKEAGQWEVFTSQRACTIGELMYCSYRFIKPLNLVSEGGIHEGKPCVLPLPLLVQHFLSPHPWEGQMKREKGGGGLKFLSMTQWHPSLARPPWPCKAGTEMPGVPITKGVTKRRSGLEEYLWACHTGSLQISLTVPR